MRFTRNCQKNPRKTETPSASNNLVGFLRILKRKQNITQVSGKSTKDVTTYCREPAHYQELFRFVSAGLELEQLFLGLACLSPHHLAALVLFVELWVLSLAKPEKSFHGKWRNTKKLFLFASQKLIALKIESQKLWRMTGFPTKSSKTFSPRCQNIMRWRKISESVLKTRSKKRGMA